MRCEEKVSGGKLVCIEVTTDEGKVSSVKITGDFFLHPEDRITAIERSLVGIGMAQEESTIAEKISDALGDAQLIGATPEDLARIFKRAVA